MTHLSAILAITIAIMILGCFTAFLSSFTTGKKGRMLIFSAGISFSLAPIMFLAGLELLFSGLERIFFGSMSGYSASVSSGFIMAFVAAVPAFLSLGNLRRIKFFLLVWALISVGWIGFWTIVYGKSVRTVLSRTHECIGDRISNFFSDVNINIHASLWNLFGV